MFPLVDGYSVKKTRELVREQTRIEERIEMAIEAIKEGLALELIAKLTKLDIAKIQELQEQYGQD